VGAHSVDAAGRDLWWKNAIVYCLDVETYADADGDGIGDFPGLIDRLDHIATLGATCIWLMPFQPSPDRDDGYDITDHYGVQPAYGSLGDAVVLLREAHARGLRVIIDLVVNHTSDRHPWFRSARASRRSPFRDFYVWRDEPGPEPTGGTVFPDAEDSVWAWDERAGQYYLHHFYRHQPDLDISHPAVRDEIAKIAGFWLELGVDGFRVDAVPYLFERDAGDGEDGVLSPHDLIRWTRSFIGRRRGDALLLGEVNLPSHELAEYFGRGQGDAMHQLFDFPLMQATWLALARCDAEPIRDVLRDSPEIPPECQWATFLRNHDELTLDQLTDAEREEVFEAFAPDPDMRLFGRGIRRRVPSMLGGDEARTRMAYSLLFALRGTPVLFYGEEIGMGEQLAIPGRLSVRTPMQWTSGRNAGFSDAPPSRLTRPLVDGRFGPLAVNVADQRRDPDSLLTWMERMIHVRRDCPEIGCGELELLDVGVSAVLACMMVDGDRRVLTVHNLGAEPCVVHPRLDGASHAIDLVGRIDLAVEDGRCEIVLGPYGYRWYRITPAS
jgi:trehalose synthase